MNTHQYIVEMWGMRTEQGPGTQGLRLVALSFYDRNATCVIKLKHTHTTDALHTTLCHFRLSS